MLTTQKFNNLEWTIDVAELTYKNEEMSRKKKCKSKSDMFRKMYNDGLDIADIAHMTHSHYSFVHGVVKRSCKIREKNETSKADIIRQMYDDGITVSNISKELLTNYSYVHTIVKQYKTKKDIIMTLTNNPEMTTEDIAHALNTTEYEVEKIRKTTR